MDDLCLRYPFYWRKCSLRHNIFVIHISAVNHITISKQFTATMTSGCVVCFVLEGDTVTSKNNSSRMTEYLSCIDTYY